MKVKILLALILIIVISLFSGCATQKPLSIEGIYLAESIDENNAPQKLPNIFPAETKNIYLSINVENITPEDNIKVVWTYLDTDEIIEEQTSSIDRKGSGFISFNISISEGFPSGKYTAEVFLNGEKIKSLEFSVE